MNFYVVFFLVLLQTTQRTYIMCHICPIVHILTLMAQATMLGANLLIRSDTVLPN